VALADDDAAQLGEHLGSFLAELGEDLAGVHRVRLLGRQRAWSPPILSPRPGPAPHVYSRRGGGSILFSTPSASSWNCRNSSACGEESFLAFFCASIQRAARSKQSRAAAVSPRRAWHMARKIRLCPLNCPRLAARLFSSVVRASPWSRLRYCATPS